MYKETTSLGIMFSLYLLWLLPKNNICAVCKSNAFVQPTSSKCWSPTVRPALELTITSNTAHFKELKKWGEPIKTSAQQQSIKYTINIWHLLMSSIHRNMPPQIGPSPPESVSEKTSRGARGPAGLTPWPRPVWWEPLFPLTTERPVALGSLSAGSSPPTSSIAAFQSPDSAGRERVQRAVRKPRITIYIVQIITRTGCHPQFLIYTYLIYHSMYLCI